MSNEVHSRVCNTCGGSYMQRGDGASTCLYCNSDNTEPTLEADITQLKQQVRDLVKRVAELESVNTPLRRMGGF